ncbi:DUF4226 domain-containing protein [Mycolicibacterium novocastrense]|uniref:DUF4226 domain-containing protein n=1 Tax=Mycolicibacterium novocastrense TaxID=59813 RepID=A0AAW5SI35_MYCNV|nr:DUF4226 domain-containing protein [Mycolicibacterium novocastrense]MCV7023651.1 DUF4226 domain-containing protein [Mycolicibacterium novocastrense]GAT07705.1 uncharacterized protein RMCN_0838 [Mycolicibacterium novocastrense]
MAGEKGSEESAAGISEREEQLVDRNARAIEIDRDLDAIVKGAHDSMLDYRERLDRISAEIEQHVSTMQSQLSDTPMGTAELHRFLLAKQQQIATILAEAQADASRRREQLARLNYPNRLDR